MEVVQEGITAPIGFQAAGVHCGVKKANKDFALVYSEPPAVAAACSRRTTLWPRRSSWTRHSWHGRPRFALCS